MANKPSESPAEKPGASEAAEGSKAGKFSLPWVKVKVLKKGKNQEGKFNELELLGVPELDDAGFLEEMTFPASYLEKVTEKQLRDELRALNGELDNRVAISKEINALKIKATTRAGMADSLRAFLVSRFPKADKPAIDSFIEQMYRAITSKSPNLTFHQVWFGYKETDGTVYQGLKGFAPMILGPEIADAK